ncbi:MAG: sensor histidine kinase, partial [Terriglobales bacterium]
VTLVSDLSHEVRTLLGGVIGLNELLLAGQLDHQQRQLSQTIEHSSRSLLAVLNNIVELTRLEGGRVKEELASIDLQRLAAEAQQQNHDLRRLKDTVRFDCSAPPTAVVLLGDATRVRQILSLLISRAVTAVHEGVVRLTISSGEAASGSVKVRFVLDFEPVSEFECASLSALNEPQAYTGKYDSRWLSCLLCTSLVQFLDGICGAGRSGEKCNIWVELPLKSPGTQPA